MSRVLVLVGTMMYVVAWFVPVHSGLDDSLVPGWEAFWTVLSAPFDEGFDPWYSAMHWIVSALSNFALIGTLAVVLVARRTPRRVLLAILIASALLNTHWLIFNEERGDLRIGYYLWAASFFVIAAGLVLAGRRAGLRTAAGTVPAAL